MDKALMIPYLLGVIVLVISTSLLLKPEHISQPLSQLWWPIRFPLGIIVVDKSLLTQQGFSLHDRVISLVWWFVRLIILGLLVNITYALLSPEILF